MQDIAGQGGSTPLPDPGQAGQGQSIGSLGQDTGFEPVYSLDLNEVSSQFDEAELPRSRRTLLRYCQHDKLDCTKVETMHGEQYFVSEPSVARLIAEILERERFTRPPQGALAPETLADTHHGIPRQTLVEPAQAEPEIPQSDSDGQRPTDHSEPRQVGELAEVDERLLNQIERENGLLRDQLEKKDAQIDKKDKQIDDLIERGREDKHLIQNFQRKLGMLEAPDEERDRSVYHSDQNQLPLQATEPGGAVDNF